MQESTVIEKLRDICEEHSVGIIGVGVIFLAGVAVGLMLAW